MLRFVRGLRGGSFNNNSSNLASSNRNNNNPTNENNNIGFRVASPWNAYRPQCPGSARFSSRGGKKPREPCQAQGLPGASGVSAFGQTGEE